ncbi:RNase H family protein (plasmid) [Halobacteriovorax sp. GFR7]|uniref:RNase H family protein n=1 Tax=unclassified Halobacteriovorax TaxID=2639665 RepID=UPI003D9997A7
MPLIKLYADGSYCPNTGAAGGSYVVQCKDVTIKDRFELGGIGDSWEAEVLTYGKALQAIMQHPTLKNYVHGNSVIVGVLDCTGVETFVTGLRSHSLKGRKFPASCMSVREVFKMLTVHTRVKAKFIHVKAHTNDDTVAAFYNSEVDKHARACMEHMRARLLKTKKCKK